MSSLQTRYKKVLKAVKVYSAWQMANNRATGGGPPAPEPNTDGIKVEGVLLALKDCYGVAVTGLVPQDNDSDPLKPPINFSSIAPTSTVQSMLNKVLQASDKSDDDEEIDSDNESVTSTSSTAKDNNATILEAAVASAILTTTTTTATAPITTTTTTIHPKPKPH